MIIVGHTSGTKFMSGQSLTICRNRLNSFCGELEFGTSSKALSIIQSPYCPEIPRYDISYNNPISMESNISQWLVKKAMLRVSTRHRRRTVPLRMALGLVLRFGWQLQVQASWLRGDRHPVTLSRKISHRFSHRDGKTKLTRRNCGDYSNRMLKNCDPELPGLLMLGIMK